MNELKKETWYPVPPYKKNESWKAVNDKGELIADFEMKEHCIIACEAVNKMNESEANK